MLRELNLLRNPIQELPDYRLAILFRIPSLTQLDRHRVEVEEKVSAKNTFEPSLEVIAARDHIMHVVYNFLQPSRIWDRIWKERSRHEACGGVLDYFGYGVSHTTRPARPDDENGKDYFFVSEEKFEMDIKMGQFIQTYRNSTACEEQIQQTLKRADIYSKYNQDHPGFFDMMISSEDIAEAYRKLRRLVMDYLGISTMSPTVEEQQGLGIDDSDDNMRATSAPNNNINASFLPANPDIPIIPGSPDSTSSNPSSGSNLSDLDSATELQHLTAPVAKSQPAMNEMLPTEKEKCSTAITMNGHVIPGTGIAVDYWQVHKHTDIKYFFLTHLHGDHVVGLTSTWRHPIYCSLLTAQLLTERYVMFLFEGDFGKILYTGDFRYKPCMVDKDSLLASHLGTVDRFSYPELLEFVSKHTTADQSGGTGIAVDYWKAHTDTKYFFLTHLHGDHVVGLTSTWRYPIYCSPVTAELLAEREEALEEIVSIVREHNDYDILLGLRKLGKEELVARLALTLNEWVSVSSERLSVAMYRELPDVFEANQPNLRIRNRHELFQSVPEED
nr:hypothetical protein BaRGS_029347 [Batillaria attramentaria]